MTLNCISSNFQRISRDFAVGGVWGPRKFFDFVLRNIGLVCILKSELEQGHSTAGWAS